MLQPQPKGSRLKRPGVYGTPERSEKRSRCSSASSDVAASPLSFDINSAILSTQHAPSDQKCNGSQANDPIHVATELDLDIVMKVALDERDIVHPDQHGEDICYGALLCEARISLQMSDQLSLFPREARKYYQFDVVRVGQYYALHTGILQSAKPLAHLALNACTALQKLDAVPNLTAKAIVECEKLRQIHGKTKKSTSVKQFSLLINILGPYHLAGRVGDVLSRTSAFLQHPFFLEHRYQYFNPQIYRSGTEMQNLTHLVGLSELDLRAKVLSDEVEGIFESLGDGDVESHDSHPGGHFTVPEASLRNTLTTELMSHQWEALRFMQSREDHNWCQATQRDLRIITKIPPKDDVPSYGRGGILADAMGLGKTLTMLSTIVSTADDAGAWASSAQSELQTALGEPLWKTRATLVVVTSMQVLNVWEAEIQKHVKPHAIKTCIFHGSNRPKSPDQVIDHDIVLTTYGTLVSDNKNYRVLQHIDWHRVALDEPHWVRNQGSEQFKATLGLNSLRRWCLTGTPIQNRLDDLVSLLRFLHFEPFSHSSVFHRHILQPLTKETPDRTVSLRGLLRTVCLRRNEKLLHLPRAQEQQCNVTLDSGERLLYNSILKQCARDIDELISSQVKKKRYSVLFTAITKLRRICNHGILPVGGNEDFTADSEQDCEVCGGPSSEDSLELADIGNICPQCGKDLTNATRNADPSIPTPSQVDVSGQVRSTPLFHSSWDFPPRPELITPTSQQQDGLSSKLRMVVDTITNSPYGAKSLVFSYWTATLDILEGHFRQSAVPYLRIDGKVPYKDRLNILESFRTSSAADIPFLLMSIQTGAVGLNLTVANYVHIVEPQWNPSVEEQAIARAVRLGQERTVTIIRYIVKDSIEANILSLQRKKRSLAKFTLDTGTTGSNDGVSDGFEDLRFILDFDSLDSAT